ncbi:MAG: RES family NAD+ phosphorylase [Chitinophagaceae bacterium]
MNCCTNCFNDKEIIGFIYSNSTESGNCDCCGSTATQIIDARELEELFQPVISLFKPIAELGIVVTEEKLMHQKIQEVWKIFKLPDDHTVKTLLTTILSDIIPHTDPLLNLPVEIEVLFSSTLAGDLHEKKWDNFAKEIKYKNRFFINEAIDLDLLSNLLKNFSKSYDKGKIFYRARVSNKTGFIAGEMGKPPVEKATSGRANPNGIPYLYLSTKAETAIYESRSSYLDYITIAEFKLIEPLLVVSLREIAAISPFVFGDQLSNYITHQKYLARLEKELSRPVRRFDKELDYLPSQYLCEYAKSLGYDAIEYSSSLKIGGINIAVFNDVKLEAKSTEVYEIFDVNLNFKKLSP